VVSSNGTGITVVGVMPDDVDEGVFGRLAIHHSLALIENIGHGKYVKQKYGGVLFFHFTPYSLLFTNLLDR
jgi:hypothetical protein